LKRINSIDILRGLSIIYMISGHLSAWWLKAGYSWFYEIIRMTAEPLGSSSFLFISGMSTAISYYKRLKKTQNSENYSKKIMRSEYFFRATLLLIVAFIYNFFVTIQFHNILDIWTWFILLTISFCLFLRNNIWNQFMGN